MVFQKAERKKAKLRAALIGPSGSGKTYGALKLAQGLGGKVAFIDTEHGSGELYSHLFDYNVARLAPPFTPERYHQLMAEAEKAGYASIVLDSISHAWAGEGGLLDLHGKLAKSSGDSFGAWRDVTPKHNAFIDAMLGSSCHIIGCMRSKQEYAVIQDDRGKVSIKKMGLAPIQRDGMEYEFTLVFDIGIEHFAVATKDRTMLFDGRAPFLITEQTGEELATWLESGVDGSELSAQKLAALVEHLETIDSLPHLRNWWTKIQPELVQLTPQDVKNLVDAKDDRKLDLTAEFEEKKAKESAGGKE